MKYLENNLKNYDSFYDFDDFTEQMDNIVNVIGSALLYIDNNLNYDLNSSVEYFPIGSIMNNTNVNPKDTIDILVKINNPYILELNEQYLKAKSKKKKNEFLSTCAIQYIIADFLTKNFTQVTHVYNMTSHIFIDSLAEIGKNYNIFVTASQGRGSSVCSGININSNKNYQMDLNSYYDNLAIKDDETSGLYSSILRIVKNIAYDININIPSLVIEALLYNVPNKYFKGSLNDQVCKILNYIKLCDNSKLQNIDNSERLVDNNMLGISLYGIKSIANSFLQVL